VGDERLLSEFNVVVVGGDLYSPTAVEQSAIDLIRHAAVGAPVGAVTLAGHLPPAAVADLMAYVAETNGLYVAASDKEEFGLAIVEAMAAGNVVVAPVRGGPGSYIADGDTGVLCDSTSVPLLRKAIVQACMLVGDPERQRRIRHEVHSHLSVSTMAEQLASLYRDSSLVPVLL
jgi:glycosyltransferase involved in cell wall biosynthesis